MLVDNILQIPNWDRISNSVVLLHTSSSNYSEKMPIISASCICTLKRSFFLMFHHFKLHRLSFDLLLVFPAILLRILIFSDIFSLLFCQCSDYSVLLPLKNKNQAVHSEDRISFKKVKFRSRLSNDIQSPY